MKFSIKRFLSKCEQIGRKMQIWSHLLKKSVIKNFIFRAVQCTFRSSLEIAMSSSCSVTFEGSKENVFIAISMFRKVAGL